MAAEINELFEEGITRAHEKGMREAAARDRGFE